MNVTGVGFNTPEFCIAKLLWFREYEPQLWRRVGRVQTISDYFVSQLTGEWAGDESTASMLGIWDLQRHDWWDVALQDLGLERVQLSRPFAVGTVIGQTNLAGAKRLGLRQGIAVTVGALDHFSAAMGAGVRPADQQSISIGTVVACLVYSDQYSPAENVCIGPGLESDRYYELTFNSNGTGMLDWYLRHHASGADMGTLTQLARDVPIGAAGLMARPCAHRYSGLSGFVNLSTDHTPAHFLRAILESTAATVVDLAERRLGDRRGGIVATGGGARNPLWLQMIADMSGSHVYAPCSQEPASRGAGMLAAVAAKWYPNMGTVAERWVTPHRRFVPNWAAYDRYAHWRQQYDLLVH